MCVKVPRRLFFLLRDGERRRRRSYGFGREQKKKKIHVERERKEREGGVGNANYTSYFASCVEMMKIWHHGG